MRSERKSRLIMLSPRADRKNIWEIIRNYNHQIISMWPLIPYPTFLAYNCMQHSIHPDQEIRVDETHPHTDFSLC
jgi:hypothetical protein